MAGIRAGSGRWGQNNNVHSIGKSDIGGSGDQHFTDKVYDETGTSSPNADNDGQSFTS